MWYAYDPNPRFSRYQDTVLRNEELIGQDSDQVLDVGISVPCGRLASLLEHDALGRELFSVLVDVQLGVVIQHVIIRRIAPARCRVVCE